MEKYRLEKPKLDNIDSSKLLDKIISDKKFHEYAQKASFPEYLYWNKVKYLERPSNFSTEEFWMSIKLTRKFLAGRINSVVKTEKEELFSWQPVFDADNFYHEVTQKYSGNFKLSNIVTDKQKQYYMSNSIMEEAIASSQLEGAATTRKVAKKMIREKRKPVNTFEQMIINNYNTMVYIEQDFKNKDLTINSLYELQSMLTEKTLDNNDRGRFRKNSDEIFIVNAGDGKIYHEPPKEEFLKSEIQKLVNYANDKLNDSRFVHPVTKAIIIHFWVGYLHPFCDGNGRLARALFYWYLLKNDYWAFTYLPLSRIIKESPAQYRNAYLYSEQDENDLTYFIDYNIRKIKQAMKEFKEYVTRKQTQNRNMRKIALTTYNLNDRQINLLRYLYKNNNESTTISTHTTINSVSDVTARKDLYTLKKQGFLTSKKIGKYVHYYATEKVNELFE